MPACRSVRFNPHRRCNGMTIYKPMTPLSHLPRRRWRWIQCTGGPDGMSSAMPAHVLNINMEEPVKRKRRRLRKYGPCPDPCTDCCSVAVQMWWILTLFRGY
ncbi:hypothetical protein BHE74_00052932 [Ensete ventricosum]|nr:hypothetical protein BHE74_00052932 [Ensete ventricosum]